MPTVTSAPGLVTAINEAEAPEGSLLEANNCVIRNKDVIEPRRGFAAYPYTFGGATARAKQAFVYQDKLHVQHSAGGSLLSGTISYDTGANFADYSGSYIGPDEPLLRMKSVSFRNNLYMTTTNGVYKISNVGNTPQTAGVPQALGYISHNTGNLATGVASPGVTKLATAGGGFVTVTNTDFATQFVTNEKIFCTSSDVDFTSGTKTVTSTSGTGFTYRDPVGGATGPAINPVYFQTQPLVDSSGFLADGNHCAYRFVLDLPDNNQQILLGPPSDKFVVANIDGTVGWVTAQSKNVQLRIGLPSGLPANARLWIYRTEQVPTSIPTSEDMYKVYERALTAEDLTRRLVVIKDIVIDALLEEPLYTSPTFEGILGANFAPPKAKDVNSWSNRLWFSNTTSPYEIVIRMLAVPTSAASNYTMDFYEPGPLGNQRLYFEDSVSATYTEMNFVLIVNDPTKSVSQNIEQTSRNIVTAINKYFTNLNAFYESGEGDPPGIIRIRSVNNLPIIVSFKVGNTSLSQRDIFDPVLPIFSENEPGFWTVDLIRNNNIVTATFTGGSVNVLIPGEQVTIPAGVPDFPAGTFTVLNVTDSTITYAQAGVNASASSVSIGYAGPFTDGTFTQEVVVNRLFYSKQQQGEAVPLLNYIDVGAPGKQILRIIPLRERLYVFKEDGIFTVAGEYPFRVDLLDDTARLLAADTCAIVGNQIFCLTSQGVVSVGESGVAIVSRSWENELLNQIQDITYIDSLTGSKGIAYSWGCGYESERSYFLQIGQFGNDRVYVYNYLNRVWTRWVRSQRWGLVHPKTDRLLFGAQSNNFVFQERKTASYNSLDYCDLKITGTLGSADDTNYPISGSLVIGGPPVEVGDIVYCGISSDPSGNFYANENVGVVTNIVSGIVYFDYLIYDEGFSAYVGQPIQIYKKYPVTLKWNALNIGAPAVVKQFDEWSPIFNVRTFRNATVEFSSDAQDMPGFNVTNTVVGSPFFNDGRSNQLLSTSRINPVSKRVAIPRNQQRCTNLIVTLTINEAMAYWRLLGFNYEAKPISPLANRKK